MENTYYDWEGFFRKSVTHPDVLQALNQVDAGPVPPIAPDELSTAVEFCGIQIEFSDEQLFPDLEGPMGEGTGLLSKITLFLGANYKERYSGPLPFGLKPDMGPEEVREIFGPTSDQNERFKWDRWPKDDKLIRVTYTKDLSGLKSVSVILKDVM